MLRLKDLTKEDQYRSEYTPGESGSPAFSSNFACWSIGMPASMGKYRDSLGELYWYGTYRSIHTVRQQNATGII